MEQAIRDAYAQCQEIERKYAVWEGSYDRSHSDNIKLGKRWAKLWRLIDAAGLDRMKTVSALCNGKF